MSAAWSVSTTNSKEEKKSFGPPSASSDGGPDRKEEADVPLIAIETLGETMTEICVRMLKQIDDYNKDEKRAAATTMGVGTSSSRLYFNPNDLELIQGWFRQFGGIYSNLGKTKMSLSVTEIVWFTQVLCELYQLPDDYAIGAPLTMKQLRHFIMPANYHKDQRTTAQIKSMELATLNDMLAQSDTLITSILMTDVKTAPTAPNGPAPTTTAQTQKVWEGSKEQTQQRKRLTLVADAFFWMYYQENLLDRFPIQVQTNLIAPGEEEKLFVFLCKILQNASNSATDFGSKGIEMVQGQSIPIGAECRYQKLVPEVGTYRSIVDIVELSFESDFGHMGKENERMPELRALNQQAEFDYWTIGTDKQPTYITQTTIDAWLLHAWRNWFNAKISQPDYDFINEYCITWRHWGQGDAGMMIYGTNPPEDLLEKKERFFTERLPLIVCFGDNAWYVHHRNRFVVSGDNGGKYKGSLLSALCLWHAIVRTDDKFQGVLEIDEQVPLWDEEQNKRRREEALAKRRQEMAARRAKLTASNR